MLQSDLGGIKMKKFTAFLLAALFMFTVCIGAVNTRAEKSDDNTTLVKSAIDVEIGTKKRALFVCDTENLSAEKVELRDENGNTLSKMLDSGTKGDALKNDDVYSAGIELSSNERKIVTYTAYVDGKPYKEYEVNFYREFTEDDKAEIQVVYDGINSLEERLENAGASDEEIFDAVYKYIASCDCIENIQVEEGVSISYTAKSGIASIYGRLSDDTKGAGNPTDNAVAITRDGENVNIEAVEGNAALTSWTNPNALVVRPYRNVEGEEGFHNDRHVDAAKLIMNYTKGYITTLDNEQATPYNCLKNFYCNGFVFVDSHGLTGNGNSYISVWAGEGYTSGDVAANRVMFTNTANHVWISGELFKYYYEQENKTFDNTFLYYGTCYGMTYDTMYRPLFELGAACAYGYDASVTMGYEGYNVLAMYPYFTSLCESDNTRTHNLEETIAYAISVTGDEDPYADTGAHLKMAGDTKFVVYKPDVPLTGVTSAYDSVEVAAGSNCYIKPILEPAKLVYGFTETWVSSNPDVVEVLGSRVGYAKADGTAILTGTFTYGDSVFDISCTVTVKSIAPESVEASYNAASVHFCVGQTRTITATVKPVDCSNPTILFKTNNAGVIEVDEKGIMTAKAPGKAIVTAYSEADPSVFAALDITVAKDAVYEGNSDINYEDTYLIVANNSSRASLCATTNLSNEEYLQGRQLSYLNSYYSGNITGINKWKFVNATGGFYIYNEDKNMYLTLGDEGIAYMSETPISIFNYTDRLLTVINPETETESVCLRYRSGKGFNFTKKTSATKIDLARLLNFADTGKYVTATFVDEGNTVSAHTVAIGGSASSAIPERKYGKTFLGWDACLANLKNDVKTNAVYEDGETDKIILTFRDYDGTDIKRVEFNAGESFDIPAAPEHEGKRFIGWSADLENVTSNMIVFAMYDSATLGDVNGDGTVGTGDAVMVLRYCAELNTLDDTQIMLADVNRDGSVGVGDAVLILRFTVGLVTFD